MFKRSSYNCSISRLIFMGLLGLVLFAGTAVADITFPKIDRRPVPNPMCAYRGALTSIPSYDPSNEDSFQVDLRCYDLSALDLSSSLYDLLYSAFNNQTIWPAPGQMPPEFDYDQIMELGKNPGLGVRDLHARGITGANIGIAIIDMPLLTEHQEYAERLRLYEEINIDSWRYADMHGGAVSSIAVGQTVGVAPDADLYYIAAEPGYLIDDVFIRDYVYIAQAVRRILEINEQLPENRKIRVISISMGWLPEHTGYDDIMAACEEAKAVGILIVFSNIEMVYDDFDLGGLGRYPLADPDIFESYKPGIFWAQDFYDNEDWAIRTDRWLVPMDSRTTASPCGDDEYVWYSNGGISWAIPYIAGVYALAAQANPAITPDDFWSLSMDTGRTIEITHNGGSIPLGTIVAPVALINNINNPPINKFDDVRNKDLSAYDFSGRPDLIDTLTFNQDTIWPGPSKMPTGCDPDEIMTNAMNPGLGVRSLHQRGITGAGVNVAIIDQPIIQTHPEYNGKITAYYDAGCGGSESSMHGPAVTSLLVGENCGTASGANVCYVAVPSWYMNAAYYANALDWIVTQNETLPESEKIRVVSVSAQPSGLGSLYSNQEMWDEAVTRAEAAGILVIDATWENGFVSLCWYDADDPENVSKCTPGFRDGPVEVDAGHIHAPTAPRTKAEVYSEGNFGYIYGGGTHRSSRPYAKNGYSWSMPYCAGVLAMGWQIHPELTGEQMVDLLFQTAYIKENGAKIINPPAFINLLLENKPVIKLSDDEFKFFAYSDGPNPDPRILSISNSGLGTLNWQINKSCDWLQVNPISGSTNADTDDVTLAVTDLTPGIHICELTISDPCATNNPQTVEVTLYAADSDLPTIQSRIDSAEDGDVIVIDPGVYMGDGNRDLDFKGKAITLRSIDPDDPDIVASTIIICQGSESEPHQGFFFRRHEDANSVLSGLTITRGYAFRGGAIFCFYSSPSISNCVFVDNIAQNWGGAMQNSLCNPKVTNCTFTANSALAGGGMHNYLSTTTISECEFNGNSAEIWGGGISNRDGADITISNCIFTNNSTRCGAGMRNLDSNSVVTNCVFYANSANGQGGVIFNDFESYAEINNSIFWENNSNDTDEVSQIAGDGITIINYNCIQGWTGGLGGVGNIGDAPCFVDADIGDYHLLEGSPCINAGDPNYVAGPNETDLDGNPRVIDGRIDMGAYEYRPAVKASMKFTPQRLNCRSKGNWVKADIVLPEGISPNDVDVNEPAYAELSDEMTLDSEYIKLLGSDDGLVKLEIVFDRQVFCELLMEGDCIVARDDSLEITVVGSLTTGQYYYGSDIIRIKH